MEKPFIVLTKTAFEPEMKAKAMELAERSYPIFKKQSGLINMWMHLSHDETHMFTYFIWKDQASHEACQKSPDFAPIGQLWGEVLNSGKAAFTVDTYSTLEF